MKSEHRHELQQNELRKLTHKVQPWLESHGLQIAGAAAAVVAVLIGVIWWTSNRGSAGSAGWTSLSTAQTSEEFASVAEKYGDTLAGVWARLRVAENGVELAALMREAEHGGQRLYVVYGRPASNRKRQPEAMRWLGDPRYFREVATFDAIEVEQLLRVVQWTGKPLPAEGTR